MRDSIFYSVMRSLAVAFFAVIGFFIGIFFLFFIFSFLSTPSKTNQFLLENTEEILPNAEGKRIVAPLDAPVILQINIDKIIGSESLNSKNIRQILLESREGSLKKDRVKAIFLYIDSPGGTAIDSDNIFHALLEYKSKYHTPIYAFVDGLCASGSLYIALAADKIFASDVSLIGSVGVISPPFMNVSRLLNAIGVQALTISSGKDKDAMDPYRPWKVGEDANYREINKYFYDKFVGLVTSHRPKITAEKLVNVYGAHVFPAPLAMEYGYIDQSGSSREEALLGLLEELKISDDDYQVVQLEGKNWLKNIFTSDVGLLSGKIKHQITVSPEVDLLLSNQHLYLYQR